MLWTDESDEKPEMQYTEFVREDFRIRKLMMWNEMLAEHATEGCCLDIPEDQPRAVVCVIHGRFKGDHVMTRDEWMGDA